MAITNKKEFANLMNTYRSLTVEQLKKYKNRYKCRIVDLLPIITGFSYPNGRENIFVNGTKRTVKSPGCSLCKVSGCGECSWNFGPDRKIMFSCLNETYHKVSRAKNVTELSKALKERADVMEGQLKAMSVDIE